MKTKICSRCQQEYTPTGNCQKVCANCKKLHTAEYMETYSKEWRKGRPGYGLGSGGNQKGHKNNQWKGGTSLFKRIKLESLHGVYKCERCDKDLKQFVNDGTKNGMWAVHHKDHNRENPKLENLELLCKRCHQIEHKCWESFEA